jgi:hypothetical protein
MTTKEVANRLVDLCRQEKHPQAQEELYHNEIVSIEDEKSGAPVTRGMDAIRAKTAVWDESVVEIHKAFVSDPIVTGSHFAVTMENDITFNDKGRIQINEICVYEVQNGKIVREQFFYNL